MVEAEIKTAIGLMSGTSMDGIDAAVVRTDGAAFVEPVASLTIPYGPDFRDQLRAVVGGSRPVGPVEESLTRHHAAAVQDVLERANLEPSDVDVIGFHGHTISHEPEKQLTWQIGDGALLAALTGIDVVADFRSRDVANGGEGAPLAPVYHAAVAPDDRPLCVLNIGGVANLTWVGAEADPGTDDVFDSLLAFDTGPGNALIDDWVADHCGVAFDRDGEIAAAGTVAQQVLVQLLANPYFDRPPPKSLDRDAFSADGLSGLSPGDGAATLSEFTVMSIARSAEYLPAAPRCWIVTGGGRHNRHLMGRLSDVLSAPVVAAETVGLNGDALEAEAFGYMAVRSLHGLPISGPTTTNAPQPLTGGELFPAP